MPKLYQEVFVIDDDVGPLKQYIFYCKYQSVLLEMHLKHLNFKDSRRLIIPKLEKVLFITEASPNVITI